MRELGLFGLLPLLLASVACSTLQTPSARSGEIQRAEGPGAVFFTVEDAARDALAYGYTGRFPGGKPHMLAGTIQRVDGGFAYTEPKRSARKRPGQRAVRFSIGPEDVASYVIYRRQDDPRIDRINEEISRSAMRGVQERDERKRPIYVLTPSLDIVLYDHDDARTMARLDEARPRAIATRSVSRP